MRNFFVEQGRTRVYKEAYFKYVEEVNPRRTQLSGKRAIYKWKLVEALDLFVQITPAHLNRLGGFGNIVLVLQ